MSTAYGELEFKLDSAMHTENFNGKVLYSRSADMRYVGQNYEVSTPIPTGEFTERERQQIIANFNREHRRLYGHSKADEPVEVLTLRATAIGSMQKPVRTRSGSGNLEKAKRGERNVYYEEVDRYETTTIFERTRLGAKVQIKGPAVIEEMDSTILVRPGQTGTVDEFGNFVIGLR